MAKSVPQPALRKTGNGAGARTRRSRLAWFSAGLVALVACGAAAWWYATGRSSGETREWRAAREALAADDFAAARKYLLRCREFSPRNPEVLLALARLERRGGDASRAAEWLSEARRSGAPPAKVDFENLLLQAQSAVAAAEPRLRAALAGGQPDAGLAYEALVKGWLQAGAVERAHLACDRWVAGFPDDWRAHYWLGWVLEKERYAALASEQYSLALDGCPSNVGARFLLARTLLDQSEYLRAYPLLEECARARPDDPAVRFAVARCLQALGREGEAEASLQALVRENTMHAPAYLLLARLRLGRDDPTGALECARRAAELEPFNAAAASTLAEALRGVGSGAEADRWEKKAVSLTEGNERVAALTRQARLRPLSVAECYELGTRLRDLGRTQEAVRWLRGGLAVDPNHKPSQEALAALEGNRPAAPRQAAR